MPQSGSAKRHPLLSLLYLLLFVVAGYILFTFLALFLVRFIYGKSLLDLAGGDADADILRLIQGVTSAGAFILPPVLLAYIERKSHPRYFGTHQGFSLVAVLLTIVIMVVSNPFMEWVIKINQMMHLPAFMADLEAWMKTKETLLRQLTKELLQMHGMGDLFINLIIIALIPAIGEEFLFRGGLQNILTRLTSNYHLGIWLSAIIFSAIHLQFFGFIPRMLLGVLFGYFFVWSKSIWIAVIAHFINNGAAVVTAFYYQRQGKYLDLLDQPQDTPGFLVAVSFIITCLVLYYFFFANQTPLHEESRH